MAFDLRTYITTMFASLTTVLSPPPTIREKMPKNTEEDEELGAPRNGLRKKRTYQHQDRTYSKTVLSTGGQRGRKG